MKTIDEEIEAFVKGEFDDVVDGDFFTEDDVKRFVRHGVDLAQRWISVEDELPPTNAQVLYKDSDGMEFLAFYTPELKVWTKFRPVGNPIECSNITHWRPIEIK